MEVEGGSLLAWRGSEEGGFLQEGMPELDPSVQEKQ